MAGQIGSVQGTLATLDNRVSDISSSVKEVHRRVDRMGPINGLIRLWKEAKPMAFTLILVVLTIFGISVDTLVSLYTRLELPRFREVEASSAPVQP